MHISEQRCWGGSTEDTRSDDPVDSDEESQPATSPEDHPVDSGFVA